VLLHSRGAGILQRQLQHPGPGAEPADDGHRAREFGGQEPRLLADRAVAAGELLAGAGSQEGLRPAAGDRPLRVLDVRPRAPQAGSAHRISRTAADGAANQLERQGAVHLSGRQHDRSLRRRHVQVSADDHARRGHDDGAVRGAGGGSGADVAAVGVRRSGFGVLVLGFLVLVLGFMVLVLGSGSRFWGSWCWSMSRGSEFRRAVAYVVPYWRRLALVVALSGVSTALSLALPYLSRQLIDRALVGRDAGALYWTVGLFALASIASFALSAITG